MTGQQETLTGRFQSQQSGRGRACHHD